MVDIEDDWESFLQNDEYDNETSDSVTDESTNIEN